jgi:Glutaredoxin
MIHRTLKLALLCATAVLQSEAFAPAVVSTVSSATVTESRSAPTGIMFTSSNRLRNELPALALRMSDEGYAVDATQERIAALVAEHPVILFMKGSKLFPQCGFSNTASQILQSYNIDFHTVDVLAGSFRLMQCIIFTEEIFCDGADSFMDIGDF